MSARQPRFEVVRGDAGWFARYIAANGREVWRTSETYKRKGAALTAVGLVVGQGAPLGIDHNADGSPFFLDENGYTACRGIAILDERTAP